VDERELEHLRTELKLLRESIVWKLVGRYRRLKVLVRKGRKYLREG
jgi:hypothetical protein